VLPKHGDYKALHGENEDALASAGASSFIFRVACKVISKLKVASKIDVASKKLTRHFLKK
jgi:hypothetical protein